MPERIQLSRRKGWRKPEGVVNVARPTQWGNPFKIGSTGWIPTSDDPGEPWSKEPHPPLSREDAIAAFRLLTLRDLAMAPEYLEPLRGRDLACWCPLDKPCHADVLLELANSTSTRNETGEN